MPRPANWSRQIADFEVIRTDTATEALILENELIKRHLPKYNIMLKDNSTYPYLKITNEEWPRVISTRRILKDGGSTYGPYTSAGKAYETLNLLNRLFPYRKCEQKITGNEQVCLYYHLKQCSAPCIGAVDHDHYMGAIDARGALPERAGRRDPGAARGGDAAGLRWLELRAGGGAAGPDQGGPARARAAEGGQCQRGDGGCRRRRAGTPVGMRACRSRSSAMARRWARSSSRCRRRFDDTPARSSDAS